MVVIRILLIFVIFVNILSANAQSKIDHSLWDQILKENVSDDGLVNYKGFKKDSLKLGEYFLLLSNNTPTELWSKEEKLAYWINAYNAYTVKLIIDNYPIKSIKNIKNPWGDKFIVINKKKYSLNDIEHKILRKLEEPRIHFAINCASFSCPLLSNMAYTSQTINERLDTQTKNFINDPNRNIITKTEISISKIFTWFKNDFKTEGKTVSDFINKYSKVKIDNQPKKGYKDYDWRLNEK